VRPSWVTALNELGDPRWVALDEQALLVEASARTGLDDFGEDTFRKPLGVLLESIERDARLHFIGRVLARDEIVNLLENRLRITAECARHRDITQVEVSQPIFITGLPRTGTSLLHELFSCDRASRVPLAWEVRHPCPPPEAASYDRDPRIARADRAIGIWNAIVPEYPTIHELGATIPVECIMITAHEFRSDQLAATNQASSYAVWLATADLRPAYELHRRFLQVLSWKAPRERWVLKAPSHLASLDALLAVYPDARIVQTHRDPLRVMGSVTSTLAATARVRSDQVDTARLRTWFGGEACAALLERASQMRETAIARDASFVDVRYADLMRDPLATISSVYRQLGLELRSEAAERMSAYLAAKPKDKHGAHDYAFAETGFDVGLERQRFIAYQTRYGVPPEEP